MTLLKETHYYLFSLLPWLGWDQGLLPALPASYSGLKVSSSSVRGIQLFGRGSTIYILCWCCFLWAPALLWVGDRIMSLVDLWCRSVVILLILGWVEMVDVGSHPGTEMRYWALMLFWLEAMATQHGWAMRVSCCRSHEIHRLCMVLLGTSTLCMGGLSAQATTILLDACFPTLVITPGLHISLVHRNPWQVGRPSSWFSWPGNSAYSLRSLTMRPWRK